MFMKSHKRGLHRPRTRSISPFITVYSMKMILVTGVTPESLMITTV